MDQPDLSALDDPGKLAALDTELAAATGEKMKTVNYYRACMWLAVARLVEFANRVLS